MAKFDRKVARQKSEYQFTKKSEEKPKRKFAELRDNFSLKWIKINVKNVCLLVVDFFVVNLIFIPLFMRYFDPKTAFVLGHGVLTSLLVVITYYFIDSKKPPLSALLIRYCFMVILLGITSFITVTLFL